MTEESVHFDLVYKETQHHIQFVVTSLIRILIHTCMELYM